MGLGTYMRHTRPISARWLAVKTASVLIQYDIHVFAYNINDTMYFVIILERRFSLNVLLRRVGGKITV